MDQLESNGSVELTENIKKRDIESICVGSNKGKTFLSLTVETLANQFINWITNNTAINNKEFKEFMVSQLLEEFALRNFSTNQIEVVTDNEVIISVPKNYLAIDYIKIHNTIVNFNKYSQVKLKCNWFTLHRLNTTTFYRKYFVGCKKDIEIHRVNQLVFAS